ncbi:flagellar biosynthetic protein FliR [Fulvimarina manganoxydans]|uniref:Flagellar biosynthetic protein FliR n=1 Tax=Fulvimarina manganoxydans TaxID=937218 RepID=A0A1W2CR58_9HYPH|nr:flagellar biosynthetic protein FliR [Fulvimarina manganoxydans]MEE2950933.1 flagellar biosynthetic protein FliR [Pseudomonadota bacterium]SMC87691.1 flagellar biosynthetic protein FliR [Fulvimarina manganoxydans]
MSEAASALVFALFLIFCRIGTCMMLMPGFSSSRIPAQVRLFLSFAITLALSPIILPQLEPLLSGASDADRLHLIASELLNGFFIGLLGRVFLIALSFAGHVIANAIGMGQAMGPVFEDGPDPTISTLVTFTATTLIFVLNLHAEIARALVASYSAMPAANGFSVQASLINIADNLDEAFMLCLRISSPFVLYAVIVNFAIGLANKLTPTIPIYFISLPFVLAGGLVLFGYVIGDFLILFMQEFQQWVLNG